MTRTFIEQWLPTAAIGAESLREHPVNAKPPTHFMHIWWARRPLAASRAAVLASLLPAWPSVEEAETDPAAARVLGFLTDEFPGGESAYRAWFLLTLGILGDPVAGKARIQAAKSAGIQLEGNGYGYPRAFTYSPSTEQLKTISRLIAVRAAEGDSVTARLLDPFAGGGSIPFEAARLGCDTTANELNPVATAILHATVAQPAIHGPEFAETIRSWGNRWAEKLDARLSRYFPRKAGETVVAYIWAHTVPCPTTGRPTPIAPDYWLSRGKNGRDVAVALHADASAPELRVEVVEGAEARAWGPRATYKQGTGESVWTGETFSGEYIRKMAAESRVGQMLLALCIQAPNSSVRRFRAPEEADLAALREAAQELARLKPGWEVADLLPSEPVPPGWKTDEPRRMGITRWSEMFSDRQLLSNVTALETLHETINEARGALSADQTRGLSLYLAIALDKACDYNGMLSSWHATRTTVRNTFDRHDFAYKWSFAEFDAAHALLPWALSQAEKAYRGVAGLAQQQQSLEEPERRTRATVVRGSAGSLPMPDGFFDVIVTDPPYYDNVMYAECSDYFYVWLKRALRDTWPELTELGLTDKQEEAVANPSLFKDVAAPSGRGRKKISGEKSAADLADERYELLLTKSFKEALRVLKPDGVLTVMFTHKRIDAWDTLGVSLLDAGFSIDASWPVHTESEHSLHQAKKNAATSTIFLACRKRAGSEPAYWADIRRDVERVAEEAAHRFATEGMTGVDLTIATYGPVLSVLSDRWPVYTGELDADGQPEVLRPDKALDLARERVAALKKRGLLGGRDVEFDRVTDWWLLAWSDFQAAEFPYDEARKLSIATHLELDDLAKRQKVVKQGSGTVTLLSPAQRRTANGFDPDDSAFESWLDRLHALMLVYDEEGLAAARSWLARTGLGEESRFSDLVEAALHAVPRVKDKGVFARPEARVLDSLRAALFDHIAVPADPEILSGPTQMSMLDGDMQDDGDEDAADE